MKKSANHLAFSAALAALITAAVLPAAAAERIDAAARDKAHPQPTVVRLATILREAEAKARGKRAKIAAARAQATAEAAVLGWIA